MNEAWNEFPMEPRVPPITDPQVLSWLRDTVEAGECQAHLIYDASRVNCDSTCRKWSSLFGITDTGPTSGCKVDPKRLAMFKQILDQHGIKEPAKKPLECTMPETLAPGVLEWLEASVKAGKCQSHLNYRGKDQDWSCDVLCHTWIDDERHGFCAMGGKLEYINMFKAILAHHKLPSLEYEVPLLTEEERKTLTEMLIHYPQTCCADRPFNCNQCRAVLKRVFSRGYMCCNIGGVEPKATQISKILQTVSDKQDSLLPPHNVVQFAKLEREKWIWWMGQKEGDSYCPSTRGSHIVEADCDPQCKVVFPKIKGNHENPDLGHQHDCPCQHYSEEITRAVIEKCLALGVKFEEYPMRFLVVDKRTGQLNIPYIGGRIPEYDELERLGYMRVSATFDALGFIEEAVERGCLNYALQKGME